MSPKASTLMPLIAFIYSVKGSNITNTMLSLGRERTSLFRLLILENASALLTGCNTSFLLHLIFLSPKLSEVLWGHSPSAVHLIPGATLPPAPPSTQIPTFPLPNPPYLIFLCSVFIAFSFLFFIYFIWYPAGKDIICVYKSESCAVVSNFATLMDCIVHGIL